MFVGDFNSKSEAFGCASKNDSGPILKTIQNTLDLIYLNNTEHTYMDEKRQHWHTRHGVHNPKSNNTWHPVSKRVDLGSDHLPIEITIDTTPHRNTFTNSTRYKFDQTDREPLQKKLGNSLEILGFFLENFQGIQEIQGFSKAWKRSKNPKISWIFSKKSKKTWISWKRNFVQ